MQQVDHILNEMRILNNLEHPFIVCSKNVYI